MAGAEGSGAQGTAASWVCLSVHLAAHPHRAAMEGRAGDAPEVHIHQDSWAAEKVVQMRTPQSAQV